MNCRLCQKEFDAYMEEQLDPDIKDQILSHLRECKECNDFYRIQTLAERLISEEKQLQVNPFLSSRVMSRIESPETIKLKNTTDFLRPAIIGLSIAAAIFFGVVIGSIPTLTKHNKPVPVELALIDDNRLESIELLSTE